MSPNPAPFRRLVGGKLADIPAEQARRSHHAAIEELQQRLARALIDLAAIAASSGTGALPDGNYGDITISGGGTVISINNGAVGAAEIADGAVSNAKLADMATARIKGRVTAGSGDPEDLTGTQATTLLDVATTLLKGLVPAPGSATGRYLDDALGWTDTVRSTPGWFGTGFDGDVVISSDTTITRAMFYNNLTVNAGITLTARQFPIYVAGTLTNNGTIHSNGNSATNGSNGGGNSYSSGDLVGGANGGGGGATGNGAAGATRTAQPLQFPTSGATSGLGGAGGGDGVRTGGAGGTISTTGGYILALPWLLTGRNVLTISTFLPGGSGGGGGGGTSTESGGGGGGGAGVLVLAARHVINNGTISANGGNGSFGNGVGNGGGGGGGGGGKVVLPYETYTGAAPTVNGGAGGVPPGTGTPGAAGASGLVMTWQV